MRERPHRCRPGERRDPYAVPCRLGALSKTFRPTNAGGYGSLLSQGRRKRIQLSNRPRGANGSGLRRPDDKLRDEAIHLSFCCAMDCFASLAMTLIEFRI